MLNYGTFGITPSADSYGGLIAQVPVLLGDRDINHQIIQISAEKKEGYVSITELEGPVKEVAIINLYSDGSNPNFICGDK